MRGQAAHHINDTQFVTAQKLDGIPHDRAQLTEAISKAEARVAELDAARAAELERLATLTAQLSAMQSPVCPPQLVPIGRLAPRSPAEKVKIFRDLFRGRGDVYPTRFVSKKTGKPGYAPACNNKFVPGLCGLPKVKCGDCSNQGFPSVDDAAILDHLRGHHVMGVYPMLENETCWFLAIDFELTVVTNDTPAWLTSLTGLGVVDVGNPVAGWQYCQVTTSVVIRDHTVRIFGYIGPPTADLQLGFLGADRVISDGLIEIPSVSIAEVTHVIGAPGKPTWAAALKAVLLEESAKR